MIDKNRTLWRFFETYHGTQEQYNRLMFWKIKNSTNQEFLEISGYDIKELPNNIKVKYLHLAGTKVTTLPDDLEVTGSITISEYMNPYFKRYANKYDIRYIVAKNGYIEQLYGGGLKE